MEFRLVYRGPLKGSNDKDHKHAIRRQFHPQLKELWKQMPLKEWLRVDPEMEFSRIEESVRTQYGGLEFSRSIGAQKYVPLVRSDLELIARLDITLLRPGQPGALITQGGDIDNRLKNLFDALRIPLDDSEVPGEFKPDETEKPMYCLLENDSLITAVSVTTDRLLEQVDPSEVLLVVHVHVRGTRTSWRNMVFL